jgi:hypothetical protein
MCSGAPETAQGGFREKFFGARGGVAQRDFFDASARARRTPRSASRHTPRAPQKDLRRLWQSFINSPLATPV